MFVQMFYKIEIFFILFCPWKPGFFLDKKKNVGIRLNKAEITLFLQLICQEQIMRRRKILYKLYKFKVNCT